MDGEREWGGVVEQNAIHREGQSSKCIGLQEPPPAQYSPLILPANVILLGKVHQVDNRFGGQEQMLVQILNLVHMVGVGVSSHGGRVKQGQSAKQGSQ